MKKILLAFAFAATAFTASAQTNAQDWTKTDCNGNNWNLFSMLDSGKVVVMEFVMPTSCFGCHNAAGYLEDIWSQFNVSHPGKVEMFAMGYNNSYTCATILSWQTTYNINMMHPIEKCGSELAYYGSMGMPTIVIVGGVGRMVFYEKMGFSESDTTNIKDTISLALSTSGVSENAVKEMFSVYPNPAKTTFTVEFAEKSSNGEVEIFNTLGEKVQSASVTSEQKKQFSLEGMAAGVYYIRYKTDTGIYTSRLIKE